MSTKLVRYKDVCAAVIPMIADMLQKGDDDNAIRILKALGALEEVDLAKEIQRRCLNHRGNGCDKCEFYNYHNYSGGCFWAYNDNWPKDWKL